MTTGSTRFTISRKYKKNFLFKIPKNNCWRWWIIFLEWQLHVKCFFQKLQSPCHEKEWNLLMTTFSQHMHSARTELKDKTTAFNLLIISIKNTTIFVFRIQIFSGKFWTFYKKKKPTCTWNSLLGLHTNTCARPPGRVTCGIRHYVTLRLEKPPTTSHTQPKPNFQIFDWYSNYMIVSIDSHIIVSKVEVSGWMGKVELFSVTYLSFSSWTSFCQICQLWTQLLNKIK